MPHHAYVSTENNQLDIPLMSKVNPVISATLKDQCRRECGLQ